MPFGTAICGTDRRVWSAHALARQNTVFFCCTHAAREAGGPQSTLSKSVETEEV